MPSGSSIYVGGLSHRVSERDLERFFRVYGNLRDVVLKNGYGFVEFEDHNDADDAVYELNGKELMGERVTVEFARGTRGTRGGGGGGGGGGGYGDRDRGGGGYNNDRGGGYRGNQQNYNNHRGNNNRGGWVDKGRFGLPTRTDYRLTVENLSSRASWQDLKDFMRQAGEVTYADAHKQRKNEGVVEFSSYADMKNAIIKLDGKELSGRRIRLVDTNKSRRSARRSRSASRSRSPRSRSHSRSVSHPKSVGRSASRSHSPPPTNKDKRPARSLTPSPPRGESSKGHGRDLSRSRSPPPQKNNKFQSRSHSRSFSASPPQRKAARNGADSPPPPRGGNRDSYDRD